MSQQVPTLSYKQLKTGQRIYYSLIEKQSQNKVLFNERLLVLVEQKYLGYTKQYNKKDLENSIDLSKLKKKIPLNDIRRILNINKQVTIMINQYDKFNKLKSTKWLFRMDNEKLAEDWTTILQRQNSPSPSRKTTQHNRPEDQKSLTNQNSPSVKSLLKDTQTMIKKQQSNSSRGKLNNTVSEKLLLQRQKSKQKQIKILKYIQVEQEKQKVEREKQRLKNFQMQRQRQRSREKEKQKEKQRQKQRQKEKQKQKQKLRLLQQQKEKKEKEKQKQNKKQLFTLQGKFHAQNKREQDQKEVEKQQQNDIRFSDKTFTFKQNFQQQNYSPPKREARINYPNSNAASLSQNWILDKNRIQADSTQKLKQKDNKKTVQKQLQLNKNKSHKFSEYKFRHLGSVLTNRQKEIDTKKFTNYFKQTFYLINDHQFQDFYSFVQMKIQQLLMQDLQNKQTLRLWIEHIQNKNGVSITVLPTELKQIPGNATICDEGQLKAYLSRAKNMDYIWRIISQDKILSQVFLMPMTCMAQFEGLVAFFTCVCQVNQQQQNFDDYSQYFEILCEKTKISKSIIENPSCVKFTKFNRKFIITQINQLLPKITSINSTIRPEMFLQIAEEIPVVEGYQKKDRMFTNSRLYKKEEQQQNKYFKQPISQTIQVISRNLDKLQEYVVHPSQFSHLMHLYGLNIVYIHEIYNLIENNYIKNILKTEVALRSFKTIYRKRVQQLLKSWKKKQKSQSIYIETEQNISKQDQDKKLYHQRVYETTKSLLNTLLSNSKQSNQLWNVVTLHSQINFKLSVEKESINKGYFLLGLEHHLGLKLSTQCSSCEKIFALEQFIDQVQFVAKIKPCQLYWIDDSIYNLSLNEAADRLLIELELSEKQIPFYIYENKNILEKIYEILSLYHNPHSGKIKHLHMFKECHQSSQKTLFYYRRKLSEIKWFIKSETEQISSLSLILEPIQQKLLSLKQSLIFYFGSYHPFYTEIYDILINIHEKQGKFEKAEEYSKLTMSNMIQLCGGNTMHIKLANNYYQKGQLYQNWGKIEDAITSYKKSKNILQYNEYFNSRQYAMVELKLSLLYLNKYKDSDSFKLLYSSLRIFCRICKIQLGNSNQTKKSDNRVMESPRVNLKTNLKLSKQQEQSQIQLSATEQLQIYHNISTCLQLLNRCVTAQSLDRTTLLISETLYILGRCLDPQYPMSAIQFPDLLTVKLVKIIIENYFIQHKRQIGQQFFNFIEILCDSLHNVKAMSQQQSHDFSGSIDVLKKFIINGVLMQNLDGFNSKAKIWIDQLSLNKKVSITNKNNKNKDIQKFQMLSKALIVVAGEAFIIGILNDKNI